MAGVLLFTSLSPSLADNQDDFNQILPPASVLNESVPDEIDGEITSSAYPMIRLTPDKPEIVRLSRNMANVIVGNDAHLSVYPDSSRTLVLIPRLPGATYFEAVDSTGRVIMGRHVIVASPKQDYIRVRRTCTAEMDGCQRYSVFFCPDMCHEVNVMQEENSSKEKVIPEEASNGGMPDDLKE